MKNLCEMTGHALREDLAAGKITAAQLLDAILARIRAVDAKVKAYIHVNEKGAAAAAAQAGKGALAGIPIVLKDNLCVRDEATTCGSKILKGFRPPYDATVVRKLKDAGAVLTGKANMDEFAFGSSCETSCYGATRNPWDLGRIPGGSSGGSAAAVAAGEAVMALGSDTGGSIRQPAAMCGVVGLKPTYGRVSRYGLIAFASSLDQIGPITKDVEDAAILLNVIAGYDEMDSTSVDTPVPDYRGFLRKDLKGVKVGIPKEYFIKGIDAEVLAAVNDAKAVIEKLGATVVDISLPHTQYAVATYYIVGPAEASSNLARFDGVQYGFRAAASKDLIDMYIQTRSLGFGNEAKRRILLGTYALSSGYYDAYYLKAQKVRTRIREDFSKAFAAVDCILTPTAPTAAFAIGEKTNDPLSMYLSDIFTIPANLSGIPGMSLPCGFTKGGLPVGLQLLADAFCEDNIFTVASAYEAATDWRTRRPALEG